MSGPRLIASLLEADRLVLHPLDVSAADEMVDVLSVPALYEHTGGTAPDRATLRDRYRRQTHGASADGSERWLNWIIRDRRSAMALGYVQVTVVVATGVADVAWVIGAPFQRRGYATEAATAVVRWLDSQAEVKRITAHIAPDHHASQAVARRLGFRSTSVIEEDEVVWVRSA